LSTAIPVDPCGPAEDGIEYDGVVEPGGYTLTVLADDSPRLWW
jgi:hypothetical protein